MLLALTLPLHAAIIDLDGTMVDTVGDFELALNRMLADFGEPPVARDFVLRSIGKGSEHLVRSTLEFIKNRALAHTGITQAATEYIAYTAAFDSYQRHYGAVNGQASAVFAGVLEGLEQLKSAGLPLACLTNKPSAFARALLQAKGLDGYFSQVFGGDAFERKKPDPLPVLATCAALGTLPQHTLVVGDSSNDAQAALAAGCPVVLVTYGYNHGRPITEVAAHAYVDRLDEIFAALRRVSEG
jgi:phosphoglycolate phosphatase